MRYVRSAPGPVVQVSGDRFSDGRSAEDGFDTMTENIRR